jgi:hypothetical protein
MAIAKIKTRVGTLITIEGGRDEIVEVVSLLKSFLLGGNSKQESRKIEKLERRDTATDLIMELREEGFFNQPKSLGEIVDILQEKGYVFKMTSLSGTMISLVKKRLLGRKKINKKWQYGK